MTQRRPADARTLAQQHGRLVALAVAADEFGVSTKTIRRRIADGTVTGYRIGRLIRVDLDELRRALVIDIPSAR